MPFMPVKIIDPFNRRALEVFQSVHIADVVSRHIVFYIDKAPANAYLYYNRGNAYVRCIEFQHAVEDYTQAIQLDPHLAEAYYNRTIAASLSPMIVQEDMIEKWDGKMPQIVGGNGMMLDISKIVGSGK